MANNELHVVFGTGPLGVATAQALLRRGRVVRVVNRSGAGGIAGAQLVRGDAYNPASVAELTAGAAAVYQCAQPAYTEWQQQFPPLQSAVIEGVARSGAKLVVAENLYMYGPVSGPIHEGLPYAATNRKGATRARMAEQVIEAHRSGKLRTTAGRGSDFFGPGVKDSTLGELVFAPALAGKAAQLVGRLDVPHTYTYIEDFGEALAVLGERDEALGRAWHVPNPETRTQREVAALIFAELGAPAKLTALNRFMMRLGGLFIPAARETVEMMYEFEEPFVVDASAYTTTFGDYATPLREALRRTIGWYRAHAEGGLLAAAH